MEELNYKDVVDIVYILKEMNHKLDKKIQETQNIEEYLSFETFNERIDELIDKLDDIKLNLIKKEYPEAYQ